MSSLDVWATVHAERAALIADLANLADESWEKPSLCAEWSVHEVVAHLIDTAKTTRLNFVLDMAGPVRLRSPKRPGRGARARS